MTAAGNDAGEPTDSGPLPVEQDSSQDGASMEDGSSADALLESGFDGAGEPDAMGDGE
jgi:hypothetical protein